MRLPGLLEKMKKSSEPIYKEKGERSGGKGEKSNTTKDGGRASSRKEKKKKKNSLIRTRDE